MGAHPKKLPLPMGDLTHLTHDSLGPSEPQTHLDRSSRFCADDRRVSYTLQWFASFSPQNCPLPWGIWTPSNTWFLGPTRIINANHISIDSAVFAWLASVSDRQTDRPTDRPTDHTTGSVQPFLQGSLVSQTDRQTDSPRYSVGKNRPHLCTAMRCNNT